MILAVALLGIAVFTATAVLLERARRRTLVTHRARRRVIVTLKSGQAFSGILIEADAVALVLREATVVERGEVIPVDGEVLCLAAEVDYLQFP